MAAELEEGEQLFAFKMTCTSCAKSARAMKIFELVQTVLLKRAGIGVNFGKSRAFDFNGIEPSEIEKLGKKVWNGRLDEPAHKRGMEVLGTPIGTVEFAETFCQEHLAEPVTMLEQIAKVPDLQSAWLILSLSASPRAVLTMRTFPPSVSSGSAAHDRALWQCLQSFLGYPESNEECLHQARTLT